MKFIFVVLFMSSVLLASSGPLQAQQTFGSLDEVWKYALDNNAGNHVSQLAIEEAAQEKKSAGSFILPSIGADVNTQDNIDIPETPVPGELVGKSGETVYLKFSKHYNYNAGLTLNYTILDWQSVYQSKIAGVNLQLKKADKAYFEQNLKEQLSQVYYAALTAQKSVEIGSEDLSSADSLLQHARDRFKEGTSDAIEVNQAAINRNSIFQNLESSKQYQDQCLNNLRSLMGMKAGEKIVLTEKLSPPVTDKMLEKPVPDIKYLETFKLQQQLSGFEEKKSKSVFLPKVGFKGYWGKYQYQDDLALSFSPDKWKPNSYIGMSVTIPLFSGFSNKSNYSAARLNRQIAVTTYRDEVRKSVINDSILYKQYLSSIHISASAGETFSLSAENLGLAWEKYKQGLLSMDGYLDVFNDYLSAESQYLNSLSEFLTKKATIESRENK